LLVESKSDYCWVSRSSLQSFTVAYESSGPAANRLSNTKRKSARASET
jgi:hypothetical protein